MIFSYSTYRLAFYTVSLVAFWILSALNISLGQGQAIPSDQKELLQTGSSDRRLSDYASDFNNPKMWDSQVISDSRKALSLPLSEEKRRMPFPFLAFQSVKYESGNAFQGLPYYGLNAKKLILPKPYFGSEASVRVANDDDSPLLPVMFIVAVGPEPLMTVNQMSLPRSYPNYFYQGNFSSKVGEVDWAAIRTANGKEIGIVNGRILDLSFGNLILVRQINDGSIRILQHRKRLERGEPNSIYGSLDQFLNSEMCKEFTHGDLKLVMRNEAESASVPDELHGDAMQWTDLQLSLHADNYNSPSQWSKQLLEIDVKNSIKLYDGIPFPKVAFPAPYYLYNDKRYGGLRLGPSAVASPALAIGASLNEWISKRKTQSEVARANPLLYLAVNGASPLREINSAAFSRSKPHFFFQGAYESDNGRVDWLAIRMKDGTCVAVINGRVINLALGNVILLYQEKDGFIRIIQHPVLLQPDLPANIDKVFSQLVQTPESKEFLNSGQIDGGFAISHKRNATNN